MPQNKSAQPTPKAKANSKVTSSIVHKPFATGTLNFFNPHRRKPQAPGHHSSSASSSKLDSSQKAKILPKVFLNAELENPDQPTLFNPDALWESEEIEYQEQQWLEFLLTPWSLSAIAIVLMVNLISGAALWRNYLGSKSPLMPQSLVVAEGSNLAREEFLPLNLSTLSLVKTANQEVAGQLPSLRPISPALAPLNQTLALSAANSDYHYVLLNYTGDRSLNQARTIVPQVSLVNFPQGAFIYLGAFSERHQAQEFVSQINQKGLGAQVYPFD